jgi:cell division protein FtsW
MNWLLSRLKGDKVIWITVFLLMVVSMLAIYSASSTLAFRLQGGNTEYYALKHLILLIIGFVVMFLVHLLDYRLFGRIANVLLFTTIPLLLYTLMQGSEINEAARWITIFGQSFQPSDLAKLSIMIFLAKLLTQRQKVIKDFNEGFLPALFWMVIICGLIAPANLSTAMLIFISAVMVMFVSGVDMKYILVLAAVAVMGLFILFSTAKRSATWKSRMNDYMERVTNSEYEANYQTTQANIAVASGGMLGKGAGKSTQRNFLPQAYSDFVFAVIVEEYGLVGGLLVMGLYLLLLFRTVSIVTVSKTFGALMAAGLAFMMVLQALVNMGVTVGLLPITGLVLPLLSMGGTSILFNCVAMGIILSVSKEAMNKSGEDIQEARTELLKGRDIPGLFGVERRDVKAETHKKRNFFGIKF